MNRNKLTSLSNLTSHWQKSAKTCTTTIRWCNPRLDAWFCIKLWQLFVKLSILSPTRAQWMVIPTAPKVKWYLSLMLFLNLWIIAKHKMYVWCWLCYQLFTKTKVRHNVEKHLILRFNDFITDYIMLSECLINRYCMIHVVEANKLVDELDFRHAGTQVIWLLVKTSIATFY